MGIISSLYSKVLSWAAHRHAKRYLAIVSFAEASFFPVPVDVMLAPMILASPRQAFAYAKIAIWFSVCGGILGYLLGYFAFHPVVEPLINIFGYQDTYYKVVELFQVWGFYLLCCVGCIPVPYKLFTISAGMLGYNLPLFVLASIISRSIRFFLVSAIIKIGGEKIKLLLPQIIEKLSWLIIGLLIIWLIIKFITG